MSRKMIGKGLAAVLVLLAAAAGDARAQLLKHVCPDINKEPCVTAKKSLVAAQVIVLGDEPQGDDWTYMAEAFLQGTHTGVSGEQKFKDGMTLKDAIEYWKAYAASPLSGDGTRIKVIDRAYLEVYGLLPLDIERKVWAEKIRAREAWYAVIVSKEIAGLNSAEARRRDMIARAYNHAFGRPANDAQDMAYWLPRKEHYRPLIQAQRRWLYSEQGAKDLWFAAEKALKVKYQKQPSLGEVNDAIEKKFKPGKLIYIEMVKAA